MIDLNKSYEFFQPSLVNSTIHIIGCGSVGSTLAENLVRFGLTNIVLWDMDTVCSHNIANQMFREADIGKPKVEALFDILYDINPDVKQTIKLKPDGWNGQMLSGYLFLCVDSIETRQEIVKKHFNNMNVKAVFDFRTGLTSAQHYAADWKDYKSKQNLLNSMQFTHDEASAETPVSACGITLGVATTVRLICALGVNNFVNFVKGNGIWKFCQMDGFHGVLDCF